MLIKTLNLVKTYTVNGDIQTPALRGVDIAIDKGEFVAIAGPSGSGKTSLLNLLGALDTPTSGSIFYEDTDITKIALNALSGFRLTQIGFVFQAYNLINTLTALENVEYIMLLQGQSADIRRKKAVDILARVGLGDYINRFPRHMSGGQQQRVAVARSIAAEPKVVLADEPTANLDSKTAESLIELMKELNAEKGITFIFSTHDKMVMDKARRLINLHDGKVVI